MLKLAYSLLKEKTFTIKYHFQNTPAQLLNLPELCFALYQNKPFYFPKLQAHQKHGLYSFLANLIALCLGREHDPFSLSVELWTTLLQNLNPTAFDLFVDDLSLPAFFQNPTKDLVDDNTIHPDLIDYHHTKKDWDLKLNRVDSSSVEHWIYYLINVQTMSNYGGRGNYGTIKTAFGSSTRICASFVNDPFFHTRIQRDVPLLISYANENPLGLSLTGHKLLWTIPRDSNTQISLTDCHPLFIDCARIYRLVSKDNCISILKKTTKGTFIKDESQKGVVGDFWLPVKETQAIHLNTPFNSSLTYDLLENKIYKTPAVVYLPKETQQLQQGFLYLEGMISAGNCKTASFDRKYIVMSKGVLSRFAQAKTDLVLQEKIQNIAKRYLSYVDKFYWSLVEKPIKYIQKTYDTKAYKYLYDLYIDESFFYFLSEQIEKDDPAIEEEWIKDLDKICHDIREMLYQKSFSQGIFRFENFAKLNKETYQQRKYLNIKAIEVKPHMKVSDIKMRNQVYARIQQALQVIISNNHDNTFLSQLRKKHLDPSFNPAFQKIKFVVFNNYNLTEKEEKIWSMLFARMSKITPSDKVIPLGEILSKAELNNIRLHRLLTLTGDALMCELNSALSIVLSRGFSEHNVSWSDVALLLLSEDTEDELLTRKMIADSYFRNEYKGKKDA